jgi:hypothetical protein
MVRVASRRRIVYSFMLGCVLFWYIGIVEGDVEQKSPGCVLYTIPSRAFGYVYKSGKTG